MLETLIVVLVVLWLLGLVKPDVDVAGHSLRRAR